MSEYITELTLPDEKREGSYLVKRRRVLPNRSTYPFRIFSGKLLSTLRFAPVTIFYGSNGSGKSTLLNVIAELGELERKTPFNRSEMFTDYLGLCALDAEIPRGSRILTSDDVFDYLLRLRGANEQIHARQEEALSSYRKMRDDPMPNLKGLDYYDEWKEHDEAKSKSASAFVRTRSAPELVMNSNGERALDFFIRSIDENALYLLDEPENSLSVSRQIELKDYLYDSARYFGCQFVLATHSPIFLSLEGARIYDLDSYPARCRKWTELENVRSYYAFFRSFDEDFARSAEEDGSLSARRFGEEDA